MRPLLYSINVTLDGSCDHTSVPTDEELHRYHTENLAEPDALLCGRGIYEMMESAWREPAETGVRPDWMEPWMEPFARTIHEKKKYVVSSTLDRVDWNAELVGGDLKEADEHADEGENHYFLATRLGWEAPISRPAQSADSTTCRPPCHAREFVTPRACSEG